MEPIEKSISEAEFRVLMHLRSHAPAFSKRSTRLRRRYELLLTFAQASPTFYELAEHVDFNDPVHPGFRTNPYRRQSQYSSCYPRS